MVGIFEEMRPETTSGNRRLPEKFIWVIFEGQKNFRKETLESTKNSAMYM